jgi:long-chain fatty acid transport protein
MKTTNHILATAIATLFIAPAAFATNGTNMTGVGAQAVALGGTGVAAYYGAENVIVNPAMIGKGAGTEFTFGGTLFKPSVSNNGLNTGNGAQSTALENSSADTNVIPSIALSSRINSNLSFGIGAFGTSGMGVNYNNPTTGGDKFKAQSTLQIMRFVPTLAYNTANAGVGASAIIQYGALDINYDKTGSGFGGNGVGSGMSSDLGYGISLGGYYDISKQFTVGASYTSAINMKYKNQLTGAATGFGGALALTDNLEQPAEIKMGAAYTMGNIMLTGDLKQIRWSEAKGYKDFGWQDQNVLALGAKYLGSGYWMGFGYNKGDNPIKAVSGATMAGAQTNMFNNVFFPATTEQHFSFGGGYDLSKSVSLEAALMYAPEVSTTVDTSSLGTTTNTTKHSQVGYTVQAKYKF